VVTYFSYYSYLYYPAALSSGAVTLRLITLYLLIRVARRTNLHVCPLFTPIADPSSFLNFAERKRRLRNFTTDCLEAWNVLKEALQTS